MTISAYVGLPGHGKSYGVVENVILPAIKSGRRVLTNIPMNKDAWISQTGAFPEEFEIKAIADDPAWWDKNNVAGSVIVLDELYKLWPSGMTAKNIRESDKLLLAEHRHLVDENGLSTEIVFVTQDLSQIASFARCLVETTYRVVKLTKLGLEKKYRVDVFTGAVTGHSPPKSKLDTQIFSSYKKEIYALYKSHTKSISGLAGNETRTDQRFKVFGGVSVKIAIFAMLASAFFLYFGFAEVSKKYGVTEEKIVTPNSATQNPQPLPSTINQVPAASKPDSFEFLSKATAIVIVWNNGHWPKIDYRFKVIFPDNEAVFSTRELSALKYKLKPINDCMVLVEGPDFNEWAMCPRTIDKAPFAENVLTGTELDNSI